MLTSFFFFFWFNLVNKYCWTEASEALMEMFINMVFGVSSCDISALWVLHYINCAGGINTLTENSDAYQVRLSVINLEILYFYVCFSGFNNLSWCTNNL